MPLDIIINSVSLKGTQAEVSSEHGGGYVFDLRCLPNPGRIEAHKSQTGLDKEVAQYLASQDDVVKYLTNVKALLSMTVKNYQKREFDYLSISFGCTGGQHRSVFFAEQIASYLSTKFSDISINVNHINLREKNLI